MYCYKCGKQIPDDSVFCPFCSERITSDSSQSEPVTAQKTVAAKSAYYYIVCTIAIISSVFFALSFLDYIIDLSLFEYETDIVLMSVSIIGVLVTFILSLVKPLK